MNFSMDLRKGAIFPAAFLLAAFGLSANAQVAVDGDDIGGVVTSPDGPEAGVWVIAETDEFDTFFADRLQARDHQAITDREGLGPLLKMAHPSLDHYLPALTIAGASDDKDNLLFMNESIDIASVSMRSFIYY